MFPQYFDNSPISLHLFAKKKRGSLLMTDCVTLVNDTKVKYLPRNAREFAHSRDSAVQWRVFLNVRVQAGSQCAGRAARSNSSARRWRLPIPGRPSCSRGTRRCRPAYKIKIACTLLEISVRAVRAARFRL